jgi:hypothetical protein
MPQFQRLQRPPSRERNARIQRDRHLQPRQPRPSGTIAEEFRRCGIYFEPAKKGNRVDGWTTMKRMLLDAGKPDVPGLYISRKCEYFWATVPYIARDKKRVEDADTDGPDHAADAARYACRRNRREVTVEPLRM